jgi:RNA polymerase sigma factor (sigma-70 family)
LPDSTPVSAAAGSSVGLARGVSRGDPQALAAFYRLWFDRIYLAARRLTGRDEAFCLDVVQEVMLKVARKFRPLDSEEAIQRWMARIVRTTAIDLLRREQRRSRREGAARAVQLSDTHEPLAADDAELFQWLSGELDKLAPIDRDLLTARIARGHTLQEVAASTGLSPDAVHGRVRRTVTRLGRAAREIFP